MIPVNSLNIADRGVANLLLLISSNCSTRHRWLLLHYLLLLLLLLSSCLCLGRRLAPLALALVCCSGLWRLNLCRQFEDGETAAAPVVSSAWNLLLLWLAGERLCEAVRCSALVLAARQDLAELAEIARAVDSLKQYILDWLRLILLVSKWLAECRIAPTIYEVNKTLVLKKLLAWGSFCRVNGKQAFYDIAKFSWVVLWEFRVWAREHAVVEALHIFGAEWWV